MSKYISQYSATDLLTKLSDKGFIEHNDKNLEKFVLDQQQNKELPLYLRALIGVGAFIASLCFIAFVAISLKIDDEEGFIVSGLFFAILALGLQKTSNDSNSIKSSFYIQTSFAFMATGKSLFTFGMAEVFNSGWGATLAIVMITAATYHVYKMSVDRFLSTFFVFFSILLNILWDREIEGSRELLLNGFVFLQMLTATILITNVKIKRDYIPLMYGALFSLCASVLFLASHVKFGYWKHEEIISSLFVNFLLTISLIASMGWIVGDLNKLKAQPLILAFIGAALLGFLSAPGIILAIMLMILGYAQHEQIMTIMGALLIPVFLFFYYFNLDISLMEKSTVLIGSGIALLAGHFYISFKKWNKGNTL